MSTETAAPAASPAPAAADSSTLSGSSQDLHAATSQWIAAGKTESAVGGDEGGVSHETGGEEGAAATELGEGEDGGTAAGEGGEEGGKGAEEAAKPTDKVPAAKLISVEHNGVKYDLPLDLPVQFKVNGEVQTRTLEEALKANSAAGAVSQAKETARLAVQGARAEIAAAKAEADTLRGVIKAIRANPAQADRIVNDPEYAELWEKGVEADVRTAAGTAASQAEHAEVVAHGRQVVLGWINEAAAEFPGVDPNEVLASYKAYLQSPAAQSDQQALTPGKVREFYEKAHGKVKKIMDPIEQRLAAIEKENRELKAALKKNGGVEKVLERGKAPPVGGAGNGGVGPGAGSVSAVRKDGSRMTLEEGTRAWASQK